MERIVWKHQSMQPFYVFEQRHVVHFWDDGITVYAAADWYRDTEARLSALRTPNVYLKALSLESYKTFLFGERLPIRINLSGPNVGHVNLDSGDRGECVGASHRRILCQQTHLFYDGDALVFAFVVETSQADAMSAPATMSKDDRAPRKFTYEFRVPLGSVPEVLNFTERERQMFLRLRPSASASLSDLPQATTR